MPHDEIAIAKLLQSRGLRVTHQRLLVLDAICDGHGHTTLAAIIARVKRADESIDQSTVHRTVSLMCRLGVVAASSAGTAETIYEIISDPPHHHLVCTACGKQDDIPHETMRAVFAALRGEYGFVVGAKHVILQGLCAACVRAADES